MCIDSSTAPSLNAVMDSNGVYRYCDEDCDECTLSNDHAVCLSCSTGLYLFEDGTCRNDCEWDEVYFWYLIFEDDGELYCVNEYNCPVGYGFDYLTHTCKFAEEDDITTPYCLAFHWHSDPDNNIYFCDECDFGFYFRDYALDYDSGILYAPYCYPNFWMAMEDNLLPYYWPNNRNL